jgi:hypothetical protein
MNIIGLRFLSGADSIHLKNLSGSCEAHTFKIKVKNSLIS